MTADSVDTERSLTLVPKPMGFLRAIRVMKPTKNPQIFNMITAALAPRSNVINLQLVLSAAAISAIANILTLVLGASKDLSTNFASTKIFVGDFWHRQATNLVIEADFKHFSRFKSVRFSDSHFCSIV